MKLRFELAGSQIDGARDYQEDSFLSTQLGNGEEAASLIIVADGMGGHAAGNVASNIAVQTFNKHVTAHYPTEDIPALLREAMQKANQALAKTVEETPALRGMGCTLVAALLVDDKLWWISVGDSLLYLLRDGRLLRKNANHSYGGFLDKMAAAGKPIEPEEGFSRNMLMSALTGDEIADIDCPKTPLELAPGDRVLVATDGLDTLSEGKIVQFGGDSDGAREYVDALLKAVDDAAMPRQDNTTVVVADVRSPSQEEAAQAVHEESAAIDVELAPAPPAGAFEGDVTEPRVKPAAVAAALGEYKESRGKRRRLRLAGGALVLLALAAGAAALYWQGLLPGIHPPGAVIPPPLAERPALEPAPEPTPEPAPPAEPQLPAPGETDVAAPAEEPTPPVEPEAAPAPEEEGVAEEPVAVDGFRDRLRGGGQGPEMVWIPAGSFTMGSPPTRVEFDERPQRTVQVGRIAVSRYEITFQEYERFARATGRAIPDNLFLDKATHPVIFVRWDDALYYARWLSEQTGQRYRLPSEAEWEYFASAGTDTPYWWGHQIGRNRAHCFGCGTAFDPRRPARIGSFDPNPFGLYDTAGNVAEWVQDCYHPNYEGAPVDGSVWEGGDCSMRVVRGGSFSSPPPSLRSAKRDKFPARQGYDNIGFRVVRDP